MTSSDDLAGMDEIVQAGAGILTLAAEGVNPDEFCRYLGMDPAAVRKAAEEAASEEFKVIPGMPPGADATGRLRKLNLSAKQRREVEDALTETFISALEIGAVLMRARQRTQQEGENEHG